MCILGLNLHGENMNAKRTTFLIIYILTISCFHSLSAQHEFSEDNTKKTPAAIMLDKVYDALGQSDYELTYARIDSMEQIAVSTDDIYYIGVANNSRGEMLRMEKEYSEAIPYYKKALTNFKKIEERGEIYIQIETLGMMYTYLGVRDSALHYFHQAPHYEDSYSFTGDSNRGKHYNSLGILYSKTGQIDSSIHYYLLSLEKADLKPNGRATTFFNLATKYMQIYNYDKARIYADSAFNIQENVSGRVLGNINILQSKIELSVGNLQGAEVKAMRGLEILQEANQNISIPYAKTILADIYFKQKAYEKAKNLLNEVKKSDFKKDDMNYVFFLRGKLQEHLHYNNLSEVSSLLDEAFALSNKNKDLYNLSAFYAYKAAYHKKANNYKEQAMALEEYRSLKDSLYNIQRTQVAENLETKYQTEKKEQVITQLKLEDELQASQLSFQRWIIFGGTAALALLSGLLWTLFGRNKKIKQQNVVISTSLEEKNILLKEIHHRVKNNLQVISSLLALQSRKIKDNVALEAIQDGRTRVHSMSLIHQNLYKKDNLTGIEFKDYFDKLSKSLFNTYNISADRIQLETNIDSLNLDVDTVVPLGLILNELITNSLKYAFPDDRQGLIEVSLQEDSEGLRLSVNDNGIGIENPETIMDGDSFGYDLIDAFKLKLGADLNIKASNGTHVDMLIRKYKKVA